MRISTEHASAAARRVKKAAIISNDRSSPQVLERTRTYLENNDFEIKTFEDTAQAHLDAANHVRIGERDRAVCYIGGSAKGNDEELVEATKDLVRKISNAGYVTVYPGSGIGMMGEIHKAAREANGEIVSIFSLQVAEAVLEEITPDVESIIVAPNEGVRQKLYHLLSGAQIAMPGGTGTKAEAAVHFYQNTQIGLIYRDPKNFTEENFPSPIIYFSPVTEKSLQWQRQRLTDMFNEAGALTPSIKKAINEAPFKAGYWDDDYNQFRKLVDFEFSSKDFHAFVKRERSPEDVVEQLNNWQDPEVRDLLQRLVSAHFYDGRKKLNNILLVPENSV